MINVVGFMVGFRKEIKLCITLRLKHIGTSSDTYWPHTEAIPLPLPHSHSHSAFPVVKLQSLNVDRRTYILHVPKRMIRFHSKFDLGHFANAKLESKWSSYLSR